MNCPYGFYFETISCWSNCCKKTIPSYFFIFLSQPGQEIMGR